MPEDTKTSTSFVDNKDQVRTLFLKNLHDAKNIALVSLLGSLVVLVIGILSWYLGIVLYLILSLYLVYCFAFFFYIFMLGMCSSLWNILLLHRNNKLKENIGLLSWLVLTNIIFLIATTFLGLCLFGLFYFFLDIKFCL